MTWHQLATGPHAGKTLPEVFFTDPDYLLDGIEAGEFDGAMLAEATQVRRLAACIRVPRDENEDQEVAVFYHLLPDHSFGGFAIVAGSDAKLAEFALHAAARSEGLDVTMPRRIVPGDRAATKEMVSAVLFHLFGDPHRRLTRQECLAFFDDSTNFQEERVAESAGLAGESRS